MILHDLNAIFVHVPKTAGNFLTRNYLRRYSDDYFIVTGHQDGAERFEVRGDITTHKHMALSDYAQSLDLSDYYVVTAVRDPVERLISAYFSPGRRFRLNARGKLVSTFAALLNVDVNIGAKAFEEVPIAMESGSFDKFVQQQKSFRDYLDGYAAARGLFLLSTESPLEDLNAFLRQMGQSTFDLSAGSRRLNQADYQLSESQWTDCQQIVMASRHAEDYAYVEQLRANAMALSRHDSMP